MYFALVPPPSLSPGAFGRHTRSALVGKLRLEARGYRGQEPQEHGIHNSLCSKNKMETCTSLFDGHHLTSNDFSQQRRAASNTSSGGLLLLLLGFHPALSPSSLVPRPSSIHRQWSVVTVSPAWSWSWSWSPPFPSC